MPASIPTIEDFFSPEVKALSLPSKIRATSNISGRALTANQKPIGDGFTPSELSTALTLSQGHWQPQQPYDAATIGQLSPGSRRVSFTARVVNLYDRMVQSKRPKAAKGCLKVLLRDDEAALLVSLWYAQSIYDLRLGSLVTIWTTHVSPISTTSDVVTPRPASLLTSIFPERDVGSHLMVLEEDSKNCDWYRTPLGLGLSTSLPGLMSLKAFMEEGGSEVHDAKVLVYVKAISPASTSLTFLPITLQDTSTKDQAVPVRKLGIADESFEVLLHLFGPLMNSTSILKSNETVLLISYPGWRPSQKLSIKARTQIDINPLLPDAEWLRQLAMQANHSINEAKPPWERKYHFLSDHSGLYVFVRDPLADPFKHLVFPNLVSPSPLLFNLASLSACLDVSSQPFTGYLPLVITRVNLTSLTTSAQLFSMQHCYMPIFANSPSPKLCEQCGLPVPLRLNPCVIGGLVDETGYLGATSDVGLFGHARSVFHRKKGRMIWTDEAWADLFGRSPEAMAALTLEEELGLKPFSSLRYLDQRLAWMRVIMLVGWTGNWGGGRLCVLRVVG
ncbi:MAG: hypothetical protein Q9160_006577 [Pyrenula sp. 1 TL-2023]